MTGHVHDFPGPRFVCTCGLSMQQFVCGEIAGPIDPGRTMETFELQRRLFLDRLESLRPLRAVLDH